MAAARHEGGIQGCVPELISLRLQVKPLLLVNGMWKFLLYFVFLSIRAPRG